MILKQILPFLAQNYPIKDFRKENVDIVECCRRLSDIRNQIIFIIRQDLFSQIKSYWGHDNFDIWVKFDFQLKSKKINIDYIPAYELTIGIMYYDGQKEKFLWENEYIIHELDGIKINITDESPKGDYKDVLKIFNTFTQNIGELRWN